MAAKQQIADWLKRLGVEQYVHCFDENDIDFSVLCDLNDQDLEKIGVVSLGHRRKLLRAIANLKNTEKNAPPATSQPVAAPAVQRPDFGERRQVTVIAFAIIRFILRLATLGRSRRAGGEQHSRENNERGLHALGMYSRNTLARSFRLPNLGRKKPLNRFCGRIIR